MRDKSIYKTLPNNKRHPQAKDPLKGEWQGKTWGRPKGTTSSFTIYFMWELIQGKLKSNLTLGQFNKQTHLLFYHFGITRLSHLKAASVWAHTHDPPISPYREITRQFDSLVKNPCASNPLSLPCWKMARIGEGWRNYATQIKLRAEIDFLMVILTSIAVRRYAHIHFRARADHFRTRPSRKIAHKFICSNFTLEFQDQQEFREWAGFCQGKLPEEWRCCREARIPRGCGDEGVPVCLATQCRESPHWRNWS